MRALTILLVVTAACGKAERQAAEARADSLQRVLQHQQDSLKALRKRDSLTEAREQDSLAAASARTKVAQRRSDSLRAAEHARPRDLTLFSSTGLTVGSQSSVHYAFVLDSAANCLVHGHIEVQPDPSSKSDVQVLVLAADDYTNWRNNAQAQITPLFKSPAQTATTISTAVTQGGTYDLVISNRFSLITKKTIQGQVIVTCRGVQPRQPG